jgi:hypothetical protein
MHRSENYGEPTPSIRCGGRLGLVARAPGSKSCSVRSPYHCSSLPVERFSNDGEDRREPEPMARPGEHGLGFGNGADEGPTFTIMTRSRRCSSAAGALI